MMGKLGILMMAYGSPESLDDMEAYLNDIRGGRPMSPEFVEEFRGRYAQIGGKSPLNALTFAQAEATEVVLRERGVDAKVYVGMRHWMPWIKDAVADMHADGVTDAVAIVMAPHYSSMSIGRYWQKVKDAQEAVGSDIDFQFVDSWSRQKKLLDAQLVKTKAGLAKFDVGDKVKVVFSAHSLPARLKEMGDPYDDELQDNAQTLADRLGEIDWMFSYQSAAKTGEPWLGPKIEDVILELAQAGYRNILSVPIGFVCDHVEVLYDIDIGCQEIAQEQGVRLERVEMMNNDSVFVGAVADAIEEQVKSKGPHDG
ncbi:MAG: ferrochelatase [Candidatus Latescibacteria bacterium]|jgi:protoporphyrin/coproporphyrin ferrochelatase|nr:ferrochelatase [Candidatus Latescibacterota bacterium]